MIKSHNNSVMVIIYKNQYRSIYYSEQLKNLWKIGKMKRWVVDNNKHTKTIVIDYNKKTNIY